MLIYTKDTAYKDSLELRTGNKTMMAVIKDREVRVVPGDRWDDDFEYIGDLTEYVRHSGLPFATSLYYGVNRVILDFKRRACASQSGVITDLRRHLYYYSGDRFETLRSNILMGWEDVQLVAEEEGYKVIKYINPTLKILGLECETYYFSRMY